MGRFAHFVRRSEFNYSEQAQIQRNMLANAIVFFARGVPVIYYGDEQGFIGYGGDQASRQDMMPSKVTSYNEDYLLATKRTTADDNFDANHPFYQQVVELTQLYQQNPALRFGQQETLYAQKTPGLFVISRAYQGQKLVIAFNTDTKIQQLSLNANSLKALPLSLMHAANADTKLQGNTIAIAPLSFAIFNTK